MHLLCPKLDREAHIYRRASHVSLDVRLLDIARLEESVDTYEKRVAALELVIKRMQEDKDNTTEALPPALEDLPPHY